MDRKGGRGGWGVPPHFFCIDNFCMKKFVDWKNMRLELFHATFGTKMGIRPQGEHIKLWVGSQTHFQSAIYCLENVTCTPVITIYLKDINFCKHKFSQSLILANIYFWELLFLSFGNYLLLRILKYCRFCGHISSRLLEFRIFSKC